MNSLKLIALDNFPFVEPNDNLINLISSSIKESNLKIDDGDVFVIAQKIVSKSENRYINLDTVEITSDVKETASKLNKHPGFIQLIINESNKIISTENSESAGENKINIPKIDAGRSLVLLTIAGILYQIKRSENLKYLGLKFFFVPMYSRLQKDTLTDEPTRQKLLKYIYSEPGANFKQLKDKFSLHNGTLAHHINILENHEIITSHRSGRQRLFFPMGVNQEISRISLVTNETQRNIMSIVKDTPGITQAMISKQLNMSRQKVNYHVNSLVDKAFLKIEKQGRITRLYPLYYT